MTPITDDQVSAAIREDGISAYLTRKCSICASPLYYRFSPDGTQCAWDGNCDCVSYYRDPQPEPISRFTNYLNMQTPEIRAEIWAEFKASTKGAPQP